MENKSHMLRMRVSPSWLSEIDEWRRREADLPSRAEAIRRIIEIGKKLNTDEGQRAQGDGDAPSAPAPSLDFPQYLLDQIEEYRSIRPFLETTDAAIRDLIEQGLEYADPPETLVQLGEDDVRAIRQLANGKSVEDMARQMIDYAIRAYRAKAEGDSD